MSVFGNIMSHTAPERAVQTTLRKWIKFYLSEIERQAAWGGPIAVPKSWPRTNVLSGLPGEDSTPAVVVFARGTTDIRKGGQGRHDASFRVGVAGIVASYDASATRDLAGMYGATLASILLQRPNLDGQLGGRLRVISWDDLRLDDLGREAERTLGIARLEFTIEARDVVTQGAGPAISTPPEDPTAPSPDRPRVESIHVDVVPKED